MEINITRFLQEAAPMDYSASQAEIGANAGPDTWQAACEDSADFMFLDTEDKREAWREDIKGYGAWNDDEIAAWSDIELNALFIQFVAGTLRELGFNRPDDYLDWEDIEARQQEGNCSSRIIYQGYDGAIYFYVGM